MQEDLGEECDEGRQNGKGSCSYECKILWCGDGVVSPENKEECEPPVVEVIDGVPMFEERTCGTGVSCSIPDRDPRTDTIIGGCRRIVLQPCPTTVDETSAGATVEPLYTCGNATIEAGEECDAGGICTGGALDGMAVQSAEAAGECDVTGGDVQPLAQAGCSSCFFEYCGDGVVQQNGPDGQVDTADDEQCDNGSRCSVTSNACRYDEDCPTGETCTYGDQVDPRCSSVCRIIDLCGNGETDRGEQCDDGNRTSGDGCNKNCAIEKKQEVKGEDEVKQETLPEPRCGDGSANGNEACDDGNTTNGDGCDERCTIETAQPRCGDSALDEGEECDDGDRNADGTPGACRTDCRSPTCGDSVVDPNEECDMGEANDSETADRCRSDCRLPWCGDGIVDSSEECDPYASDVNASSCTDSCLVIRKAIVCGNGVREATEECDDGNRSSGDGCNGLCRTEVWTAGLYICGNGVKEGTEQCDDSNTRNLDGCDARCTLEPVASLTEQPLPPVMYPEIERVAPPLPVIASILPIRYIPPPTPIAQTGPAALVAVAIGAAGGWSALRLRRKRAE